MQAEAPASLGCHGPPRPNRRPPPSSLPLLGDLGFPAPTEAPVRSARIKVDMPIRPGRVVRSPNQLWFAWLWGGLFTLLGVAETVHPARHVGHLTGLVLIVVGLGPILLFVIRTGLWITDTGIRVRNPLSSYDLAWTQIKGFRIGRHGAFSKCLLIDTLDGQTRYAFAVQVANLSLKNPEKHFVANLNQALAEHRNATRQLPTPGRHS